MKSESAHDKKEYFILGRQWLKEHYEASEGHNVARRVLYEQYVQHCKEEKLKPMSSALLGIVVHSTFMKLNMRRLGPRGNSEYHYTGMRLKRRSPLNQQENAGDSTTETKAKGKLVVKTHAGWRQWLNDNYVVASGMSMPRSAVYDQLLWHCHECNLDPISSSALGKLISSVFPGIMTRRLGTRGNSEYHYWGMQLKEDSPLMRLREACPAEMEEEGDSENCAEKTESDLEEHDEKSEGDSEDVDKNKGDSEEIVEEKKQDEPEDLEKTEDDSEELVEEKKKNTRGGRASQKKPVSGKKTGSRTSRRT
ncbi:uncharacterized protein LOC143114212 isoform X1 [Alosa pseudoharengus]|uniref:uncharacterized protein LOC143114212 isoform X1 n=1 Tax=Alosa pseudoharengus TaxID=34774 RepID=UPI003F8A7E67